MSVSGKMRGNGKGGNEGNRNEMESVLHVIKHRNLESLLTFTYFHTFYGGIINNFVSIQPVSEIFKTLNYIHLKLAPLFLLHKRNISISHRRPLVAKISSPLWSWIRGSSVQGLVRKVLIPLFRGQQAPL